MSQHETAALRLAQAMRSGEPGVLHVLPSTSLTLETAASWVREEGGHAIGLCKVFASSGQASFTPETPAGYLQACQESPGKVAGLRVVVFTDQFVSTEHAPLLVRQGHDQAF